MRDKRLIGLSKEEVIKEMRGKERNIYTEKEWVFTLKKYWWGKCKELHIEFNEKNKVIYQYTTYR